MKKSDVLIIGSGISGLFAACVAADAGKKVQILSYGAGTLTIGGGIIDVLGYTDRGKPVEDPLQAIDKASPKHPYAKVGSQTVKKALETFLSITASEGFPYIGSPAKNQWLPTAIGNFKPTCLVPRTMDTRALLDAENILVVGFDAMKDFYTGIAAKNIQKRFHIVNEEALKLDDDVSLIVSKNCLLVNGISYTLTRKECKILLYLCNQKGKVISSEELIQNLWEYHEMPSEATIRVYIKNLRNILGKDKTTISRTLNTLEKKGFITKSQKDKRTNLIEITPEGEDILEKCSLCVKNFRQSLSSKLNDEEIEELIILLEKVALSVGEDL